MPHPFKEQLDLLDKILERFYAGTARLTLCVSSGISLGRMPSLHNLINCAMSGLPQNPEADALFARYDRRYHMSDALRAAGHQIPQPLTLLTFSGLGENARELACKSLANDYGDIFQELIPLYGGKQSLLAALKFERFQQGEPDAAHQYIAYLYLEGRLQRVVSLNWDCLIEIAVQRVRPGASLNIVRDEPSWVEMNSGPQEILAKVHGCARQYPAQCGNIVLTFADVETATAQKWIQILLQDFLNGFVLFSGYRARDSTLNVPLKAIKLLRQNNELPLADYYVAQEDPLEARAQEALARGEAARHISLNSNDLFCSMYFGWLRARLREVVRTGRSRTRLERPFQWADGDWNEAMNRIERLVEDELSVMLDHVIGTPDARLWGPRSISLPVDLGLVRALFMEGKAERKDTYTNLRFGEMTRDLVMLVVLSALVDVVNERHGLRLDLERSYLGVTLRDNEKGALKQVILYWGTFTARSCAILRGYLMDVEVQGILPPEIVVIPCERYEVSPTGDNLAPGPILRAEFPGGQTSTKKFIEPKKILDAQNLSAMKVSLRDELDIH
jgi:hypothetical protein